MTDLIALERAGWEALCTPDGVDYYREHLTDDAVMAFPFGVLDREQALNAIEDAEPWSSFEIRNARVVELSDEVGVVVYEALARRGDEEPFAAVISSVFVRRDGEWKLAFHQQSF